MNPELEVAPPTVWTKFFDTSSGGGNKVGPDVIWIEEGKGEAAELFEAIFNHNPFNVTCECCGEDYSIDESEFKPEHGDWIVSKDDIEKFKNGSKLMLGGQPRG